MVGYNVREGMSSAYQKFLRSKEFRKACDHIREETGIKYVETYAAVLPSSSEEGDYDCYDLWEVPNHAALDRVRKSDGFAELMEKSFKFTMSRPVKSVTLRRASEAKIIFEPKQEK